MKTADRDRIAQLAADSGFPQEPLEKVIRLAEMAALVSRHPLLSRVLALKGGTALNLFDGPPPRLSVDLDFNYVGVLDCQEMLEERPDVERAVEAIARELKYKIQWSREEHAGRKVFLNYTNAGSGRDRIEIDLNFAHRLPLAPLWKAAMWQPTGLNQPDVQLCGLAEVAAGKICAVLDRHRPRDLFDMARLPGMGAQFWTDPSFKKLVVAFTGTLNHPLHTYGRERLERLRDVDIKAELVPMIGGQAAVDREDLISRAWQALAPILMLDDPELEFVDRLQVGEVRLDLLFPGDSDTRERLEKWPPLQWKALNARKPRPPRQGGPGAKGKG
ncbi:MAG: nucleotidyl transferase AbiEii/AbiGii toxin family protein [Candidatus Eisenbacteria bacterium]|nr:nucleotidyl transferase AbiEii/AbiGii toxin family protein [Candidatus Eisenbacteria bacterium]